MSEKNHIDQLFRDKLKERAAGEYSASAWAGASSLLDQHFKALFWRKVLVASVVIGAISATLLLWLTQQDSMTNTGSNHAQTINSEQPQSATQTEPSQNLTVASSPADKEPANNIISAQSEEQASEKIAISKNEEPKDVVETDEASAKQPLAAVSATRAIEKENASADKGSIPTSASHSSMTAATQRPTQPASKAKKTLDLKAFGKMPVYSVGALSENATSIIDRDALNKEQLLVELQKVDIAAVGGIGLAQGFQNVNSKRAPVGMCWMFGLSATYHFNSQLYARTGAIASMRSGLESRTLAETTFEGQQFVNARNLTYVDIPLQVGYDFGARHSIYFGMTFSPLVGYTQLNEFAPYDDPETGSFEESNIRVTDRKQFVRDGFAGFDAAGSLGYTFQISQRVGALVDVRFGLFDITDNTHFGTAIVDDRNHQVRMGLSYRFLSR